MIQAGFRSVTLLLFVAAGFSVAAQETRGPSPSQIVPVRLAPADQSDAALRVIEAALNRAAEAQPGAVFPLHWAAIQNHVRVITRLVERGMDVDMRDAEGRTPLMIAAAFGNSDAAETLLALGADPQAKDRDFGDAPIHFAARTGHTALVRLLLEHGVESELPAGPDGVTPLHYAAMFGHRKTIEFLVTSGVNPDVADLNGVMPQQYASRRRRPEIAAFLRGLGAREDTLFDAVNADDVARAHALIAEGADVNEAGLYGTALHLAAAKGHIWLMRTLIDAGADLEARGEPASAHPLHAAIFNNQIEAANLLIARGAGLDARDDWGRTPLGIAATFGSVAAAQTLLAAGADPLAQNEVYGETPIHVAASAGHIALVQLFLDRGIDVNVRSGRDGEAPLHYAVHWARLPMIEFLAARGADLNLPDEHGDTPLIYAGITCDLGTAARDLLLELGALQ